MPFKTTILRAAMVLSLSFTAALVYAAGPRYEIAVDGLACPFCAYGIEKALYAVADVEQVETNIRDGVVIVTMGDGAVLEEADARQAVHDAGFTLRGYTPLPEDSEPEAVAGN